MSLQKAKQSKEEEWLAQRNVKPTSVRILVLKHLLEHEKAVSLKSLEDHYAYSDKSTLFRTLKTFEKEGLVHTIEDGSGLKKYALCMQDCECALQDQHFHFYCTKCEETYCLSSQSIPKIELPNNFSLSEANLVLKGVCANCN